MTKDPFSGWLVPTKVQFTTHISECYCQLVTVWELDYVPLIISNYFNMCLMMSPDTRDAAGDTSHIYPASFLPISSMCAGYPLRSRSFLSPHFSRLLLWDSVHRSHQNKHAGTFSRWFIHFLIHNLTFLFCLHRNLNLGNAMLLSVQCRSTWMSWGDPWFWQTSRPNRSSGPMCTWMPWYDITV